MKTLDVILDAAAKQFGAERETINPDVPFADLGVDSLGLLEFMFELEDELDIPIPPNAVAGVQTMRELAARVDELVAAQNTSATPSS